jgi:hypothetical protein
MPRKTLKERRQSNNRVQPIIDKMTGAENPDDLMVEIMGVLTDVVESVDVEVGNFCTFVYTPKTPYLKYDQNPLVAVVGKFEWGFRGINYHWGGFRNYTNEEVVGPVHLIYPNEMSDLKTIPYANYRLNI